VRDNDNPEQAENTFVRTDQILDISALIDSEGTLNWNAFAGKWTTLRIGHVNAGMRNVPSSPRDINTITAILTRFSTGYLCAKENLSHLLFILLKFKIYLFI
jgi:hypothetical protein